MAKPSLYEMSGGGDDPPIKYVGDPNDPALIAYRDSSNLHTLFQLQQSLVGSNPKFPPEAYDDGFGGNATTAEKRALIKARTDEAEKAQLESLYDYDKVKSGSPSARVLELAEQMNNPNLIYGNRTSPDFYHESIKPTSIYHQDPSIEGGSRVGAINYIYAKPKQEVRLKPKPSTERLAEVNAAIRAIQIPHPNVTPEEAAAEPHMNRTISEIQDDVLYVDDPNHPRIQQYNDSLLLHSTFDGDINKLKGVTDANAFYDEVHASYETERFKRAGDAYERLLKDIPTYKESKSYEKTVETDGVDYDLMAREYAKPTQRVVYRKPTPPPKPPRQELPAFVEPVGPNDEYIGDPMNPSTTVNDVGTYIYNNKGEKVLAPKLERSKDRTHFKGGGKVNSFMNGSGWKVVKDFKGMPKHEQGGVDIEVGDDGVSMLRGDAKIHAKYGMKIAAYGMKISAEDGLQMPGGDEKVYSGGASRMAVIEGTKPNWMVQQEAIETAIGDYKPDSYWKDIPDENNIQKKHFEETKAHKVKEFVASQLLKDNPYDGEAGIDSYLSKLSKEERGFMEGSNVFNQASKSYLDMMEQGLLSMGGPAKGIVKNPQYTKKEALQSSPLDLVEGSFGMAAKPLQAIATEFGIAEFKNIDGSEYDIPSMIEGRQNDATWVQDMAFDLTNLVGVGPAKQFVKAIDRNSFQVAENIITSASKAYRDVSSRKALSYTGLDADAFDKARLFSRIANKNVETSGPKSTVKEMQDRVRFINRALKSNLSDEELKRATGSSRSLLTGEMEGVKSDIKGLEGGLLKPKPIKSGKTILSVEDQESVMNSILENNDAIASIRNLHPNIDEDEARRILTELIDERIEINRQATIRDRVRSGRPNPSFTENTSRFNEMIHDNVRPIGNADPSRFNITNTYPTYITEPFDINSIDIFINDPNSAGSKLGAAIGKKIGNLLKKEKDVELIEFLNSGGPRAKELLGVLYQKPGQTTEDIVNVLKKAKTELKKASPGLYNASFSMSDNSAPLYYKFISRLSEPEDGVTFFQKGHSPLNMSGHLSSKRQITEPDEMVKYINSHIKDLEFNGKKLSPAKLSPNGKTVLIPNLLIKKGGMAAIPISMLIGSETYE